MQQVSEFLKGQTCCFLTHTNAEQQAFFLEDRDYLRYLTVLRVLKKRCQVRIFGFCLLPEAVYLLLQPEQEESLLVFIHSVIEAYAAYFQSRHPAADGIGRTRCRRVLIDHDEVFFSTLKYIEFIPVVRLKSESPLKYPWSSCCHRVFGLPDRLLDREIFG